MISYKLKAYEYTMILIVIHYMNAIYVLKVIKVLCPPKKYEEFTPHSNC